jgi:hypothetical protein
MFTLDAVVPWGRSFDEYCAMFALDDADCDGRLLGCGDGPASFNAEATRRGASVVSCDPLYMWSPVDVRRRIEETSATVLEQTRLNSENFVWSTIPSLEALRRVRMAAMEAFLADFRSGAASGRYVAAALPGLPFAAQAFDLALCSHLLFLYSGHLNVAFHRAALLELCRVSREVRVFPLLSLAGARSPHVEPAIAALRAAGHAVTIEPVPYEFQRGGREMMRIRRAGRDSTGGTLAGTA